jgi:hypothetical protein
MASLVSAAAHGDLTAVETLIAAGADVNLVNASGSTPLFIAVEEDHDDIVRVLIAAGADIYLANNARVSPVDIAWDTSEDGHNFTDIGTLICTVIDEDSDDLQLMLLDAASEHDRHEMATALSKISKLTENTMRIIAHNLDEPFTDMPTARCNFFIDVPEDEHGRTALYFAAQNGEEDIVRMLIAAGADVDKAAMTDQLPGWDAPLLIAVHFDHTAIVRMLIAAGADVNFATNDDSTPLLTAAHFGNLAIVRQLIAAGANVDLAFDDGSTPLLIAVQNGHTAIVAELIAAGADVNQENDIGESALDIARDQGNDAIVEQLMTTGGVRRIDSDSDSEAADFLLRF